MHLVNSSSTVMCDVGFFFDVLVIGDNYTQYKPIARETNWIASHHNLQGAAHLHLATYPSQCSKHCYP